MPLVPANFPDQLAAAGLNVHTFGDWSSKGGSADHRAIVLHHTASSSSAAPADDAAYCQHGTSDAPLYNVMVDRNGEAWVLARNKANSSGKISGTALSEATSGKAGCVSASQRGLSDTTSDNAGLFAISAQNNGVGEPWSDALVNGMTVVAAVALECLGLPHAGYVTQHRVLTARKIDCCGDSCPYDFQALITAYMSGGRGPVEVPELWTVQGIVPNGTADAPGELVLALPPNRKDAVWQCYLAADPSNTDNGASLWASLGMNGAAFGGWNNGDQWELWLPPEYPVVDSVRNDALQLRVQNRGPCGPVSVAVSGT